MAGGELFSDAFTVSPLLAFRLVFRTNLELTRFPLSRAFGTRCARQPRVYAFIEYAAAYSPTYESGDKVTLRNCFPQADEGELSLAREPRFSPSPSYPPFRLLNPTRPRLVPAISSCCSLLPALNPARFYFARRRSAQEEESRIYAKSMREGVLRNRYFVTGEITTCVIRGLSVSTEGFLCHYLSCVFEFY